MTAEYPGALWVPADASNYSRRMRQPADIDHIVIHITDGHERARPVAEMWQEFEHGSSAHFVIDQDGSIIQAVQIASVAYHAHAANGTSIGIEHCARTVGELSKTDPGLPVSDAQYVASARLVAYLCKLCGLTPSRSSIMGHCEIDPATTHRDCPNALWDWGRYMSLLATQLPATMV